VRAISAVHQNSHKRSASKKPNEPEPIDMGSTAVSFKNSVLKNSEGTEQQFRRAEKPFFFR
jgi:hypothetical protein